MMLALLSPVEQAVLAAYQSEAAQLGSRRPLVLDKHELAKRTGFTASRCCYARSVLINKRILRKIGFSVPMRVELL